jgi:hypothetical protein
MISPVGVRELKPVWTTSSFLVYAGGLTVLGGGLGALAYLATQFPGHGQETAWALLIFVVLYAIAYLLRHRDRPIAAGIFAYAAVNAWIVLVAIAFAWWGWTGGDPFRHWSWAAVAALLLILLAAWDARRRFRFPFIRSISVVYFFVFVNVLLPAGGNWTATWALLVGLTYLVVGNIVDKPSAFWLHLVGGGLIGGAILYWCHTSDFDYAVVSFMSLVFVIWAYWTSRSSWAVWGTIGFFIASLHYLIGSPTSIAQGFIGSSQTCHSDPMMGGPPVCSSTGPHITGWSFPLAFGLLGFWLVFLGMLGKRRHRVTTVVVETPPIAPPAPPAPPAEPPAAPAPSAE